MKQHYFDITRYKRTTFCLNVISRHDEPKQAHSGPWAPGEDQERTVRFNYDFITELMLKVNVNCPLGNKSYTNKSNYFSFEKKQNPFLPL